MNLQEQQLAAQLAQGKPAMQVMVMQDETGKPSFLQLLVAQGILQISIAVSAKEAKIIGQGLLDAAAKIESGLVIAIPGAPLPPPPGRA